MVSRRFCFALHARARAERYVYGGHHIRDSCWEGGCFDGSSTSENKGGEVSPMPGVGLKEIQVGMLTARDVVDWVSMVLKCADMDTAWWECTECGEPGCRGLA